MEASFSMGMAKQQKSFEGPVSRERTMGLLVLKDVEVVSAPLEVLGSQFQE